MKKGAASTLLTLLPSWVVVTSSDILQQQLWGLPSGLAYYVQVNVGSPLYSSSSRRASANAFNLLLDTGSANTAVATSKCCSRANGKLYSCADSSTCVDRGTHVNVSYVSGSWTGQLVQDVFSGQGLGIVEDMPFAEITFEDGFLASGHFDGIIGLAYQTIASPSNDPLTPYFDHVRTTNGLSNIFSLQMCGALQSMTLNNVLMADTADFHAGELLLGGMEGPNRERYYTGEIVYTPLVQEEYFNVIVTDIGINGQSLGLDCKAINSPRAIIDSGSSNLMFPPSVYSAVIAELRSQAETVTSGLSDFFFNDESVCCSSECDPTNVNSIIYSLPGLTISFAVDDEKSQQMTVTIPAEYIWRPFVLSAGQGELPCRVFGISEGAFTLLGNVFMDGLFTVHDRENERVGLAVADNCPNGVTSKKNITVETVGADNDFCDCVGSTDRKGSLLSSYVPFSSKPCYFWQWWMYVIIVTMVIMVLMGVTYCYLWWKRRKLMRQHEAHQSQQYQPNAQRNAYSDDHYDYNFLETPPQQSSAFFVEPSTLPATTVSAISNDIPATSGYRLAVSPSVRFSSNTMGARATAIPRRKP